MHAPSADELAAIAAAFLVATRRAAPQPQPTGSRWALAGRLAAVDPERARFVARARARWNAAGRLDG